jgi:uncharacterized protein YdhG (YjbR/CyaY superfamily)
MSQKSSSNTRLEESSGSFTAEERAAMRERANELKAAPSRCKSAKQEADATAVLAKIAEMPDPDRTIGEQLHEIITTSAPTLLPKLWYGPPAYARDGKVVCFFRGAAVDKERYLTLGFSAEANLDDGSMWPTAYALTGLTSADEARVAALVQKAAS